MLQRHSVAMERLPEEDRRRMMPRPDPVRRDSPPPAPIVPEHLTMWEARRIALQSNPDIHAAQARLEGALARIGEARATYFPTLSAVHNSSRNFLVPESRSPLIRLPATVYPDFFDSGQQLNLPWVFSALGNQFLGAQQSYGGTNTNSFSQHSTSLVAAWTLFDGFTREARLMASKYSYRATAMGMADVERLLIQAVDTAFLQILLAREEYRIAQADEAFSRELLDVAEKRREGGKSTEADVLNFQVRVRAAQAGVVLARGALDTARVVLAELMGLPEARLDASVVLPPLVDETGRAMESPDEALWLETAYQYRPDLAQRQHMVRAAEENVRAVMGQFSPSVTLSGSYGVENQGNISYGDQDQASAIGVELNWQLFTGGFRTSQLRRLREDLREARARLERARLTVASDVRRAVITVVSAQEEVLLQRLAIEAATENRRIVSAQYAAGKTSLVRVNEAQRDYVQADGDLTTARIRLRQAWSDLYAATASYAAGLSWEEFEVSNGAAATQPTTTTSEAQE
ncbi:MAG: TolC family protein [Phycisphaerae bacterium]|nr:TolC family protein [Phycisphaerae bacterium]